MAFNKIAVMGGGSWATALAKLLLRNCDSILWYMRRDDRIDDFKKPRPNPAYPTDVQFDVSRIEFSSDINYVCSQADTLLMVMPSPYFKTHINKITTDISDKHIVSAVKFLGRIFRLLTFKPAVIILIIVKVCLIEGLHYPTPQCRQLRSRYKGILRKMVLKMPQAVYSATKFCKYRFHIHRLARHIDVGFESYSHLHSPLIAGRHSLRVDAHVYPHGT